MAGSFSPEIIRRFALSQFHISSFREHQLEIIESLLDKKDTVAVIPTGGGKSLTYQIPALLCDGLTLVISPLISLMKDQVRILKEVNRISSCDYLSSTRPRSEISDIYSRLERIKILYITPERLENSEFMAALNSKKQKVSLVVVDEAHCISLWGNTFRPSYLKLKSVKNNFPGAVIGAFTATATPQILHDITDILGLRDPALFRKSMRRDNIFIKLFFTRDKFQYLLRNIHKDRVTIIYTTSKNLCDSLVYLLENHGFSAAAYHAGLAPDIRDKNQSDFMEGGKKIMVATSAFGMGIDKKDVRHIIHYQVPLEMEEYIQEIGRAGRDGKKSYADIIAGLDDFDDLTSFLNDQYPPWKAVKKWLYKEQLSLPESERLDSILSSFGGIGKDEMKKNKKLYLKKKNIRMNKLRAVKSYLSSSDCRTSFVMDYFGENFAPDCGQCDYCDSLKDKGNISGRELRIAAMLSSAGQTISMDFLKRIGDGAGLSAAVYPGFGSLKGVSIQNYQEILYSLKNKGMIEFDHKGKSVRLNRKYYKNKLSVS